MRVRASLEVRLLKALDPERFSKVVGLWPTRARRRGEEEAEAAFWALETPWLEAPDPRAALRTLLEPLKAKALLLAVLVEQKAIRVGFCCTVEAAGVTSLELDPDTLALLARLEAAVRLELRPSPAPDPSGRPLN